MMTLSLQWSSVDLCAVGVGQIGWGGMKDVPALSCSFILRWRQCSLFRQLRAPDVITRSECVLYVYIYVHSIYLQRRIPHEWESPHFSQKTLGLVFSPVGTMKVTATSSTSTIPQWSSPRWSNATWTGNGSFWSDQNMHCPHCCW